MTRKFWTVEYKHYFLIFYKENCFESGFEYSGQNIGNPINNFGGDALACQSRCASSSNCNYFVLRNNECGLKQLKGNTNINPNAISGPKECP